MNKLPQGWALTAFTEALDIQGGTQPPKNTFKYEPTKGYIRLLQIRDFGEKPLPTYIRERIQLKTCKEDDILIARYGASIGRIVSGMTGAYNVALAKVIVPELINKNFIKYLLKSEVFQSPILSIQRSAQDGFNKDDLAEIVIPLPPLPEQLRLVAKLDALMQKVASNKQRLENIPKLLKRFRQSVLAAAVNGTLTEEWRGKNDLTDEWKEVSLSSLIPKGGIFDGPFGSNLKTDDYKDQGVRVIRLENIAHLYFIHGKKTYVAEEKYQTLIRHSVGEGDIIFSSFISEEIRACILPDLYTKAIAKADCFCIRPDQNKVDKTFLLYSLVSMNSYEQLAQNIHGATRPRINTTQLKALQLLLPDLSEQKEIVRIVEQLFTFADKIEARYSKAKTMLDKLPQSILAKAFRGELVPQDANDEPASVLLKRIKIEKDKLQTIKIGKLK